MNVVIDITSGGLENIEPAMKLIWSNRRLTRLTHCLVDNDGRTVFYALSDDEQHANFPTRLGVPDRLEHPFSLNDTVDYLEDRVRLTKHIDGRLPKPGQHKGWRLYSVRWERHHLFFKAAFTFQVHYVNDPTYIPDVGSELIKP